MILSIIPVFLILFYSVFLIWCTFKWKSIEDKSNDILNLNKIKISVVVPVRNEAELLPFLLQSLINQDYPAKNFQIIIVDDHSTDDTISVAKKFFEDKNFSNFIFLNSPNESKKEAISYAVSQCDSELIITTDADVTMSNEWISSIAKQYISTGAFLICGPVKLLSDNNYFEKLQQLEFMGLSLIGAAGIHSGRPMFCNGANLAFAKKIFDELNGYENSRSFSGDDTQLMLKINDNFPGKISYLKDSRAVVLTSVIKQESDLIQQRKRWASKITTTLSAFTIVIAFLVWFVHALLLIQFFISIYQSSFFLLIFLLAIKLSSEVILLKSAGKFFNEKVSSLLIISAQPFYCIYIVFIGLLSPFGNYNWKGRAVR